MITMKEVLIAGALVLTGVSPSISEESDGDIWAECRDTNSCTIEYDHLASQKTDPFLFLGKIVDREHPQWKKYRKSLRHFPAVRDCLTKGEQTADTPNLLRIDWQRVGTSENASVCVFRIARSLGSVERVVQWLEFHEFQHSDLSGDRGDNFKPRFKSQPVSNILARWSIDQYRKLNPSWISWITGADLVYEYQLVLRFDQNNIIAGVGVVTPTKLN